VIGALNLYATRPVAVRSQEQATAARFVDEASRALTLAVRLAARAEMSENVVELVGPARQTRCDPRSRYRRS
jgi:hypothetical protein